MRPWWVLGAEVHQSLEMVATFANLGKIRVKDVDNDNGFCLREQLFYDGMGAGINADARKMMNKAVRRLV